jgi:hypothetical protein
MKMISLKDSMTGKILNILFDLDVDKILINGEDVIRKRALESDEDQFVYGPPIPGPTIIYHLTRNQIEQMKKLWDE